MELGSWRAGVSMPLALRSRPERERRLRVSGNSGHARTSLFCVAPKGASFVYVVKHGRPQARGIRLPATQYPWAGAPPTPSCVEITGPQADRQGS